MSTNTDKICKGKFITTAEHKSYPFYGVQFHPEKNLYEWVRGKNIPHSPNAIKAAHFFSDFFVNEARKSKNQFEADEVNRYLIYNFSPTYTGAKGSSYEQCYIFPEDVKYGDRCVDGE